MPPDGNSQNTWPDSVLGVDGASESRPDSVLRVDGASESRPDSVL